MLKKSAIVLAVLYTVALTAACLMSLKDMPKVDVSNGDKIFHFGAYAAFTVLWYAAFIFNFKLEKMKALLYATVFAVVFGIVIEVLQDTMTDYRAMDIYDVVANSLGALLTALILWRINKLQVKKQ
ncbi:VanZ family protein [Algibacter lectus]|uniref:VanZ family protein n=1 Tax=Algibacter lectus TaxID=221126 RepID=UPI001113E9DA|nr:VanZ family protein [Algibacter lectus]MDO7136796.1 VanZ family protein [Algibacter lectus]